MVPYSFGDLVQLTCDVSEDEYGCDFQAGSVGKFTQILEGTDSCICEFESGDEGWGVVEVICKITDLTPAER